jgi:predicted MPP superfamily phosphohydrolase
MYYYFVVFCVLCGIISHFLQNGKLKLFLQSGLLSLICVVLVIAYGWVNMHHVVKTDFNVSSSKISNLKILAISDLHGDEVITSKKLATYVKEMNKVKPDFVVLAGDIFDERTRKSVMVAQAKVLGNLKSKYGTYYVYGNHDDQKYGNAMNSNTDRFNGTDIRNELEKNKIHVLDDQTVTIGKNIVLIGRRDASYSRKSSSELLKNIDHKKYTIVLDHQPLDMSENAQNGADLQISGHTHGGQIWPMGYVQAVATKTMRYGVKHIGKFSCVTTSGIAGWGYPFKIGAKAEYAVIHVK